MSKMMILALSLLCGAQVAQARTGYAGSYHTSLVSENTMSCAVDKVRQAVTSKGQVLAELCAKEYQDCLFHGACVIEKADGSKIGLNYHKSDELKERSFFKAIDLKQCPYGYGFGKMSADKAGSTCLIPYVTVSADALVHNVGEVLFVRQLVGVKLPNGQVHDGHVIVGDMSQNTLGAGFDRYDFFTGHQSSSNPANPFAKLGLSNPDTKFKYEIVSGAKATEVKKARGFKILQAYKSKFKEPLNPMLEQR